MIIVLDTNVCIRDTHLLRKKGGPTLIAFLRATNGQLFVPETLRREYLEQFVEAALGARNKAEAGLSALQTLVGRRLDHMLPPKEAFAQHANKRLESLEALIRPMPLTPEIKLAASDRTLHNRRPTSKTDHGFKDCVHWESVLRLPRGSDVRLVSRDVPAFFDGENLAKDLVEEALAREITIKGYNVTEHKSLAPLLRDLEAAHPLFDFSNQEAFELENSTEVDLSTVAAKPVHTPASSSGGAAIETQPVFAQAARDLAQRLASAEKSFEGLDKKVLGFVAYLGGASKAKLLDVLSEAGVSVEAARNVAERLVIAGLLRDTGHHYLPGDLATAELAAAVVEPEMIDLLTKAAKHDGR